MPAGPGIVWEMQHESVTTLNSGFGSRMLSTPLLITLAFAHWDRIQNLQRDEDTDNSDTNSNMCIFHTTKQFSDTSQVSYNSTQF